MKSAVETLSPTRVRLTVEVPFEELAPSVAKAYKKIAGQVAIPGFRRGKVPPPIIDQRVGRVAVLEEAVNQALPDLYGKAVEEHEVKAIGRPEVDVTEFADGKDLTFTAEVDVRPHIELPDLQGIAVTVDDVKVSEEDVEAELLALRQRFGTLVTVDRAAAEGDFVLIDLSAAVDGEVLPDGTATGLSYEVGSHQLVDGLDDVLLGLSQAGTATFTTTLAGGPHAGKQAEVTVGVSAVKERELPPLDDDFAELASEFDTVAELRATLFRQILQTKQIEQGAAARDRVLAHLLETVDIPVPDGVVAEEVRRHLESEDRAGDAAHGEEIAAEVRTSLARQFLLDEIAQVQQVNVSQEELTEHLVRRAGQYGLTPDQFASEVVKNGQVPVLVSEVVRAKALAAVVAAATVTDASGQVVDLESLGRLESVDAGPVVSGSSDPVPAP